MQARRIQKPWEPHHPRGIYTHWQALRHEAHQLFKEDWGQVQDQREPPWGGGQGGEEQLVGKTQTSSKASSPSVNKSPNHWAQGRKPRHSKSTSWDLVLTRDEKKRESFTLREETRGRDEYQSGLPFTSPGDLPDPGIKPGSSALQADAFYPPSHQGSPGCRTRSITRDKERCLHNDKRVNSARRLNNPK